MVEGAGESSKERPGCAVRHRQKTEPMTKFVQQDGYKVNLAAVVAVETQIKRSAGEATGLPKIGIEPRPNSRGGWVQIRSKDCGSGGVVIPGSWERRAREIAEDFRGARTAQDRRS